MMKTPLSMLTIAALCLGSAGCATSPAPRGEQSAAAAPSPPAPLDDSGVDIDYVLGHSHRRFAASAKASDCHAEAFLDRQLVKSSKIEDKSYEELYAKVEQFVRAPGRPPVTPESCRTPYTVTLRRGSAVEKAQGCRGADDGYLSKLIRDGEFLMFSRQ